MDILNMQPGRELDIRIEIELFGLKPSKFTPGWVAEGVRARPPRPFSTNMHAAIEAEQVAAERFGKEMYIQCLVECVRRYAGRHWTTFDLVHATPEQRCKAALLAVMEGESQR